MSHKSAYKQKERGRERKVHISAEVLHNARIKAGVQQESMHRLAHTVWIPRRTCTRHQALSDRSHPFKLQLLRCNPVIELGGVCRAQGCIQGHTVRTPMQMCSVLVAAL
jgi:hypothetical protein